MLRRRRNGSKRRQGRTARDGERRLPCVRRSRGGGKQLEDEAGGRGRERYSLVVLGRGGFRVDVRGWRCSRRSFSRCRRRGRRLHSQRRASAVGACARAGANAKGSLIVGHCRPAESSRPLPCDANRCWEKSSRRNHVMLDGLRAAGRGPSGMSGSLFNSLWMPVLDVCQRPRCFRLSTPQTLRLTRGWRAGHLSAAARDYTKDENSTVWSQAKAGIVPAPEPVWQG